MRIRPGPLGQRWGAVLALLAMLLISFGALASQLMQPAVPAWMHELACGGHDAAPQDHTQHADLLAKCGYCTLLLHSPATGNAAPCLHLPPRLVVPLSALYAPDLCSPAIFPGARSRAPPRHS